MDAGRLTSTARRSTRAGGARPPAASTPPAHHAVQASTGIQRPGREQPTCTRRSGRPCRRCGDSVRVAHDRRARRRSGRCSTARRCQGGLAPTDDGRRQRPLGPREAAQRAEPTRVAAGAEATGRAQDVEPATAGIVSPWTGGTARRCRTAGGCQDSGRVRRRRRRPAAGRGTGRETGAVSASVSATRSETCPSTSDSGRQGAADGGEQLGGGLLLAPLDLAEVAQGHRRGGGHLAQGAALRLAVLAQHVAEFTTKQDHGASFTASGRCRAPTLPRGPDARARRFRQDTGPASVSTPSPVAILPPQPGRAQQVAGRRGTAAARIAARSPVKCQPSHPDPPGPGDGHEHRAHRPPVRRGRGRRRRSWRRPSRCPAPGTRPRAICRPRPASTAPVRASRSASTPSTRCLDLARVGDDPAAHHRRGAGHVGERGADQARRSATRRCHATVERRAPRVERGRRRASVGPARPAQSRGRARPGPRASSAPARCVRRSRRRLDAGSRPR